ncbi:MAG: hypothetical protein SVV80_06670 [Planctomycetota bacterium]|nr:hypothetical protein [Planctomycetota bacterium]
MNERDWLRVLPSPLRFAETSRRGKAGDDGDTVPRGVGVDSSQAGR